MAAYTADRQGQELVEAHVEADDGRGHEEVYVVLRGRARFTLDGTHLNAPQGTFVKVAPGVHRQATAQEPGTVVLALGGPSTFEPSASEWIERARAYARTDPARARHIIDELAAQRPGSPGVAIGEALLAVHRGETEAARAALADLTRREPALKRPLASDPDLGPLVEPAGPDRNR
jgi:mannose-6-phosphate isomerase-like protein (cupin superfamily)